MRRLQGGPALWIAIAWTLAGCGDGAVAPSLPALELVVAGGDGQYGTPGQRLAAPLQVLVRRTDTGAPYVGAPVSWTVESGSAALVTSAVAASDGQGLSAVTIQLGSTSGEVTIRARAVDQEEATVSFKAYAVDRPRVTSVEPTSVRGGDTVTVEGAGFSPTAAENVVLFSGIRGRVTSASPARLRVEVPACLPARTVDVTAQLGELVSTPVALAVSDGGTAPVLPLGTPVDVDDPASGSCLRLPGGRRYLVTVQSSGTVAAARYGYTLRGLASTAGAPVAPLGVADPASVAPGSPAAYHDRFEAGLRLQEAAWLREGRGRIPPRGPVAGAARSQGVVPSVGQERTFKVLNSEGRFDDVTASVRLVSAQAVLYVDKTAPGGGFTASDLAAFASTFDQLIHPTVSGAFGGTSDLDANERVVILFTPTVNRLTPKGSDGFIGGFFYGLDLMEREGSNKGEIFYALVPDASGQYSDPRPRELVLRVTPAILAHEYQHMIHYNERVLKLGAEGTEALWLSEGLAQMAEELVARVLARSGGGDAAEEYRAGNRTRARRYLADPGDVSLIVGTGQGTLAERGAGWLHTLYLWDRGGGDQVLARLTQTTLTGTANVAAVAAEPWSEVFADWLAALYTGGISGPAYPFDYPDVVLRDLLRTQGPYPLSPETVGTSDFTREGSLWSSSGRHYIVSPPASGFTALRLGGAAGGSAPKDAALRLRVVPLYN